MRDCGNQNKVHITRMSVFLAIWQRIKFTNGTKVANQMTLKQIILDYFCGYNVIIQVLLSEKRSQQRENLRGISV